MIQKVFKRFEVFVDFINGHRLFWELDPIFKAAAPYVFTVQLSGTLDFSELIWELPVGDFYYAVDNSNIKQNWSPDYIYRVKLLTGDGTVYYSDSLNFDAGPTSRRKYVLAKAIMQKEAVQRKYAGFEGYLLKRKTFGIVDTPNVDPISGMVLTDNVGDYGIGIVGGYYNPLPLPFWVISSTKDRSMSPSGNNLTEGVEKIVRTIGFPPVNTKDVVVKSINNQRYSVEGIGYTYFPSTTIAIIQRLDLKLIPNTDTVYQIPVPDRTNVCH